MGKKVIIELNERQAVIVKVAIEEWFRLRMGQSYYLSNDLALYGYKRDEAHPGEFDRRMQIRDALDEVIKAMFRIAWPIYGTPEKVEPDVNVASDMWSALRWELSPKGEWDRSPFQMSTEPLPKITVEEE